MVELTVLVWVLAILFGYIGWQRGWTKEMISLAGVVLAMFTLFQFRGLISNLLQSVPPDQRFYFQAVLFIMIVFFAYQTRALIGGDAQEAQTDNRRNRQDSGRDSLQTKALGALVGFANGYLIAGTLWYFLDAGGYPLAPFVVRPGAATASASAIDYLPMYILTQGSNQNGDLLSLAMVALFVFVLVTI